MRTPQEQYERDRTALKHYLIGRNYPEALAALGHAERWHIGVRKDKVTPEFHHQLGVTFNFLNVPFEKKLSRKIESACIAALLNHDVVEDHPVTYADLINVGLTEFSVFLVKGLTKVPGETDDEFFDRLLAHWLLPILKACDRDNNVMTMQPAFTLEKMRAYIYETKHYILALLKKASRLYPEHQRTYGALASGIKKQLRIYEAFIKALETERDKQQVLLDGTIANQAAEIERLKYELAKAQGFPATLISSANEAAEIIDNPGKPAGQTIFITD